MISQVFFVDFRAVLLLLFGSSPTTAKQVIDPIKGVNENESKKERRKRRKTVACITSAIIAMSMMRFWEVVT